MNYKQLMARARDLVFFARYDRALDDYHKAYLLASTKEEALEAGYDRADLLARLERYQEAHELYEELRDLYPNAPGTHYGLAYSAEFLGEDAKKVLGHYEEAIRLDPSYHRAYYYAAHIYDSLGDKKKAISYFKKTVELMEYDYVALNDLAATYEELGEYGDALSMVEKSLSIYPNYARALYNHGVILHRLGRDDEAIESYQKSLKSDDTAITYLNISAIYNEREEFERAEAVLQKGLKNHEDSASLWYNLSCAMLRQGKDDEGIEAMCKAIEVNEEAVDWLADDPDVASVKARILQLASCKEEN